jgi:hypothetical protein
MPRLGYLPPLSPSAQSAPWRRRIPRTLQRSCVRRSRLLSRSCVRLFQEKGRSTGPKEERSKSVPTQRRACGVRLLIEAGAVRPPLQRYLLLALRRKGVLSRMDSLWPRNALRRAVVPSRASPSGRDDLPWDAEPSAGMNEEHAALPSWMADTAPGAGAAVLQLTVSPISLLASGRDLCLGYPSGHSSSSSGSLVRQSPCAHTVSGTPPPTSLDAPASAG